MGHPTDDRLANLTATARIIGCDLSRASRLARAGKFGPTRCRRGEVLISVEAIERYRGQPVSNAELETARTKNPRGRPSKRFPDLNNDLNLDFGWVRFGFEMANDRWLRHLVAHGITHVEPPPFEPELATEMATRDLFTRSEVYALLDSCVKQRDRQWDVWVTDSVQRAQFPAGPEPLTFKYPEPVEY